MALPDALAGLVDRGRAALKSSLFSNFLADACFFLLCVLIFKLQGCLQRRRQAKGAGAGVGRPLLSQDVEVPGDGADRERPGTGSRRPLSSTAQNYLAFLDTNRTLFTVLALIAIPVDVVIWGPGLIVRGETLRSIRRTMFDNGAGRCAQGFPQASPASIAKCASRGADVRWQQHRRQSPDDLRPDGYYTRASSLEECEHQAALCGAPALAFDLSASGAGAVSGAGVVAAVDDAPIAGAEGTGGETAAENGEGADGGEGECWLFDEPLPGLLKPLKGFEYCEGRQDVIPGIAEFAMSILFGLTTLVFAARLVGRLSLSDKSLLETSAVWFTGLPSADREDGEPFELEESDFQRVAGDLRDAINMRLEKILRSKQLDTGRFDVEAEKVLAICVVHEHRPPSKLLSIRLLGDSAPPPRKRLAGHAFALMRREGYAAALLTNDEPLCGLRCLECLPSYIRWQSHTLFKFGVPPWSAVTLRCQRAPPASDIIWRNLHVKMRSTLLRRSIGEILLFIFSFSLVTPVFLAPSAYKFSLALHEADSDFGANLPPWFWALTEQLAVNLPSYVLLLVNSVLLPTLITWLHTGAKPHLRSRSEAHQFGTNLFYLMVNSFLVPTLGFLATDQSRLEQFVQYFSRLSKEDSQDAIKTLGEQSIQAPSEMMLKYAIHAALVTSGCQLIQLGKGFARRLICAPDEPWDFAWGYWYAFSMSVFIISLTMGVLVPGQLPLAVLFFFLVGRVHRECHENGVFRIRFEMDRASEASIICWMIRGVAFFWFFMGLFFFAQPVVLSHRVSIWVLDSATEGWQTVALPGTSLPLLVPKVVLEASLRCWLFILAALGMWLFSWSFMDQGQFELFIWRRCGPGGQGLVVCILRVITAVLLFFGVTSAPRLRWMQIQLSVHTFAACILFALAATAFVASFIVRWLCKRQARGRSIRDLRSCLEKGREISLADLLNEEGMEGMEGLVQSAEGPFGRMKTTQL